MCGDTHADFKAYTRALSLNRKGGVRVGAGKRRFLKKCILLFSSTKKPISYIDITFISTSTSYIDLFYPTLVIFAASKEPYAYNSVVAAAANTVFVSSSVVEEEDDCEVSADAVLANIVTQIISTASTQSNLFSMGITP